MKDLVLSTIQTILLSRERVTAEEIYTSLKDKPELKNISFPEFRLDIGKWNKEGVFLAIGIKPVRGRFGGFRKIDSYVEETQEEVASISDSESESEIDEPDSGEFPIGTCIRLSSKLRIYNTDSRNWALQIPLDEEKGIWKSLSYAATLDKMLELTAKKIFNRELQVSIKTTDLKNLARLIEKAEANILSQLKEVVITHQETK